MTHPKDDLFDIDKLNAGLDEIQADIPRIMAELDNLIKGNESNPDFQTDPSAFSGPEWSLNHADEHPLQESPLHEEISKDSEEENVEAPVVRNTGNHTAADVARWMLDEMKRMGSLSHWLAVDEIRKRFGTEFIEDSDGGHGSIVEEVRRIFREGPPVPIWIPDNKEWLPK